MFKPNCQSQSSLRSRIHNLALAAQTHHSKSKSTRQRWILFGMMPLALEKQLREIATELTGAELFPFGVHSCFLTFPAVRELMAICPNPYWFWTLIETATKDAKNLPLSRLKVRQAAKQVREELRICTLTDATKRGLRKAGALLEDGTYNPISQRSNRRSAPLAVPVGSCLARIYQEPCQFHQINDTNSVYCS
jgi:hypothetical protein